MELRTPMGELTPCPKCGAQPHVYQNIARAEFHAECPPCVVRLWSWPTAGQAVQQWEAVAALGHQ